MKGPCCVATLILLLASDARGQQAASFEELQGFLKLGDAISVTDVSGEVSRGTLTQLSSSSLQILRDGATRDLAQADVLELRLRRNDPLGNGIKIGATVGLAVGIGGGLAICRDSCEEGATGLIALGFSAGVGTGLGVAIGAVTDASIVRQQTIYRAPGRTSSSAIAITPVLTAHRTGLLLRLAF